MSKLKFALTIIAAVIVALIVYGVMGLRFYTYIKDAVSRFSWKGVWLPLLIVVGIGLITGVLKLIGDYVQKRNKRK